MITIDELMTTNPFTLDQNNTLEDARQLMTDKHIRHIPITDKDNHLLGLVTQRDVLEATHPDIKNHDRKLSEIMIKGVSTIHTSDSVRRAALHLQNHKYGCLPVVVDDKLVGIVTDSDYITIAINLLEQVDMSEEEVDYEPDTMDDVVIPELDEGY